MTQRGRVEEFWTTGRSGRRDEDNVRPLLKALAAARRSRDEDPAESLPTEPEAEAVVVDLRPDENALGPNGTDAETAPREDHSPQAIAEAAETAAAGVSRAIAARSHEHDDWLTVEAPLPVSPPPQESRSPIRRRTVERRREPAAPEWGDLWRDSVQGWVRTAEGVKVWRPIVTTTTTVPNWEIDTHLGMVTGESACAVEPEGLGAMVESEHGNDELRRVLEGDRALAQEAMVREAVARGAHAVIGVNLDYTFLGECLIVTATGTAVTLRPSE